MLNTVRKLMKTLSTPALALGLGLSVVAADISAAEYNWRFSNLYSRGTAFGELYENLGKNIEQLSDGRIKVQVLYSGEGVGTTGLLGARELHRMKRSAWLVNTSRGPIVDTGALVEALEAGRIAGAGIDVYDEEPLAADHPLRSCPRTLLTPHLGYVTEGTYRAFYGEIVEDIEAWLDGNPVRVLSP